MIPPRPGRYVTTVSAPGYESAVESVSVVADDCERVHVEPDGPRGGYPGYALAVTVVISRSAE